MSSSDDLSDDESRLRNYCVVHFIQRGRQSKTRQVDVIPSNWLAIKSKGRFCTKFPELSTDPEDIEFLYDFVKLRADPPEDWKTYTVAVLGQANTYEEALKKLKILETEKNAFTGSEVDLEEETNKIEEAIKKKLLQKEVTALKMKYASRPKAQPASATVQSPLKIQSKILDKSKKIIQVSSPTYVIPQSTKKKSDSVNTNKSIHDLPQNLELSEPIESIQENPILSEQDNINVAETVLGDIDIPVINISNVKCSSDFQSFIIAKLSEMHICEQQISESVKNMETRMQNLEIKIEQLVDRVEEIKVGQQDACNFLLDKQISAVQTDMDFRRKYQLQLPTDDLDSFLAFDKLLKTHDFLKKDICTALKNDVDKNYCINKTFLSMLRRFMTKNVATKYTASRVSTDKENPKEIFKHTELYKCMEAVILSERQAKNIVTGETDLMSAISNILSNAKKWKVKE